MIHFLWKVYGAPVAEKGLKFYRFTHKIIGGGKDRAVRGQAYVEFLFVLPLLIIFLIGLTSFSKYFIVQMRMNQALRYAPWLRTYGYGYQISNEDVKNEIINFLEQGSPALKRSNLKIVKLTGGRRGGALQGPFRATKVEVDLEYYLPVPRLLSSIPGFPKPWTVRARTEFYP